MRARGKARPQLESLECKSLLSGMPAAVHTSQQPAVAVSTPTAGSTLTLSGTERGFFFAHQDASGKTYDMSAGGRVDPLGHTFAAGNLHVTSGISSGPPNGTLHLATNIGTLTLQIPKSVMIPAGLPTPTSNDEIVDTYTITNGTGAYQGDTGSGVVEFRFDSPFSSPSAMEFGEASITFAPLPKPTPPTTTAS